MGSTCVVGLQWGDEAKGKIVDLLCDQHDVVVRYQGGANAGHTVVADGVTYKLSLVPTGILRPGIDCVIGNGVVIHPPALLKEIETLAGAGGRVRRPAARQRPGPRDPAVSPGRGAADRGVGLGRRPPGHDPARDRPLLSRQGRPGPRRPGRRPVPPRRGSASTSAGSSPTRTGCSRRCCPTSSRSTPQAVADEYLGYAERLRPFVRDTTTWLHEALGQGQAAAVRGGAGVAARRRPRQLSRT